MAIQSLTKVLIDQSEVTSFVEFSLFQEVARHHLFQIVCRADALEEECGFSLESQNFLGKTITFEVTAFTELENYGTFNFKGIITNLENKEVFNDKNGSLITLQGHSCTIIADDGPHFNSFSETSLSDIVMGAFQGYDTSKLEVVNSPKYTDNILYSVQSNESAYAYINRLAKQYGEWFYYDGNAVVFGENSNSPETTLKYGVDLKQYSLELNPKPNNFKYFTNDYLEEAPHEKASGEISSEATGFNSIASNIGSEIFTQETNVFVNTFNDDTQKQRFDKLAEIDKKTKEVNQVTIKGKSDNPGIALGGLISIEGAESAQGSFRVTKVTHFTSHTGTYENRFIAVSADLDISPYTNVSSFPKSGSQIAKVFDNVDPDGLSRVKVQFPWQVANNQSTPWLRVLTPHSGLDKGFHFIPEIDDEVIIGFEGSNAERPYVMGSFYTGTNKPEEWQTDANNVKAIRTRSGHTIELNDTEGEEKINIYDNEGSIITFDTQEKSLTINATENIEIGAKNIKIVAEENIEIQAQGDITKAAQGDIAIQSQGKTDIQATGDASLVSSGKTKVEGTQEATLKGMKAIVKGDTQAEVSGVQTKVSGSAMAEVSGGIVKIN